MGLQTHLQMHEAASQTDNLPLTEAILLKAFDNAQKRRDYYLHELATSNYSHDPSIDALLKAKEVIEYIAVLLGKFDEK